jgi:lipoprotein-anchoring transpeptidase ErfK/SrfK
MMAPMGKGTRAAGTRRRADAPAPASVPAPASAPAAGPGRRARPSAEEPPRTATPPASPAGQPKTGRGATVSVAMMTIAALAGVGVLAAQAEATAPKVRAVSTSPSSAPKGAPTSKAGTVNPAALPANSGTGTRVVYSPSGHRVWLVQGSTVERTMQVVPGTITAPPGSYTVYGKSSGSVGGDGVTVLYVVKFDSHSSTTFGFDAEAGITGLPPAPTGKTGGIRMAQTDAQLLYEFASIGTPVVVV